MKSLTVLILSSTELSESVDVTSIFEIGLEGLVSVVPPSEASAFSDLQRNGWKVSLDLPYNIFLLLCVGLEMPSA